MLFFLFTPPGMGVLRRQEEPQRKHISVKGRIIGYSLMSQFRMAYWQTVGPPHDAFLFLIERGNGGLKKGEYIKIQYRATPQHNEDLPPALFEESSRRSFALYRDETCDQPTESFIYGGEYVAEGSSADRKKNMNLVRLRGAENTALPKEKILRCYSFDWDDIEK
jgi:hypothetical protein